MPTTEGAAPFPPVGYAGWKAGVEAELGPEGVTRRLRATTEDGIAIEPLYAPGGPGDGAARELADRVVGLLPAAQDGWRIRQRFPIGTPADVLRVALAGGVQSLELAADAGRDRPDRALGRLAELDPAVLRGIELSWENVTPGEGESIESRVPLSMGLDPVGRWLTTGVGSAAGVMEEIRAAAPSTKAPDWLVSRFRASGEGFHDAGAPAGLTLGATMAVALTYLRAFEASGADLAMAARQIEVRVPCGPRFFESAAMLRAARLVWARLLEVSSIVPTPLRLVASSGRRSLTRHDPWNNALRNTAVAFGAAIGGADILQLLAHDSRTAATGDAALRLARTTGLILREEAHIARVLDPAEGSWFMESLTASLAEEAWKELQSLDAAGGITKAIETGDLGRRIAEAAAARQERVRSRRHPIIGVTEHPVEGEEVSRSHQEVADAAMPGLFPFRPDALEYEALVDTGPAR